MSLIPQGAKPIEVDVSRGYPASRIEVRSISVLLVIAVFAWTATTAWAIGRDPNTVQLWMLGLLAATILTSLAFLASTTSYRTALLREGHALAINLENGAVYFDVHNLIRQIARRFEQLGVRLRTGIDVPTFAASALDHYAKLDHDSYQAKALGNDILALLRMTPVEGARPVEPSESIAVAMIGRAQILSGLFLLSGDFELAARLRSAVSRTRTAATTRQISPPGSVD